MNVGSFFVIFEVLYLHRSLLILFAFNAVIMILSSFPVTTPSDISFSGEDLYLQSRFFTNVSGVDQDNNDAADANFFCRIRFCLQSQTAVWFVQPCQPRPPKYLLSIEYS